MTNMSKTNNSQFQNQLEIECVKRFLPAYNDLNQTSYSAIEKNSIQNEVDIFVYNELEEVLKIQVSHGDSKHIKDYNISKSIPIKNEEKRSFNRDDKQLINNIIERIRIKSNKYGDRAYDLILLLDDLTGPPQLLFRNFKISDLKFNFKEIWLVPQTSDAFRLI